MVKMDSNVVSMMHNTSNEHGDSLNATPFNPNNKATYSSENNERSTYTCYVCHKTYKSREAIKYHVRSKGHDGLSQTNLKKSLPVAVPQKWDWNLVPSKPDTMTIVVRMQNIDDVKQWMCEFMAENKCKFVTYRSKSSLQVIRRTYVCENHGNPSRKTSRKHKIKGTGCPCKILVHLAKNVAEIQLLNLKHNHSLTSPALVTFYSPSEEIKQVFLHMFENGAGPADALRNFRNHLRLNCETEEEFLMNCANRLKTPNYDWVRHFYHKSFVKKYGSSKIGQVVGNQQNFIETINENICKFEQVDEDNFVVIIVTDLMRRVLNTSPAGEIMFVNSYGSVDKFGLKVSLLMTKVDVCRVPVGVLITTSETIPVLERALSLFLSFIPSTSFAGRGNLGPRNIMTNDCSSEISAIQTVFPSSRHFLCTFHILQFFYQWLNNADHKVSSKDREIIYSHMRNMLYAQTEEKLTNFYSQLLRETENLAVKKYVTNLYQRKEKWALCFHQDTLLRSCNTRNIVDYETRVLEENILRHIKAQSPSQLVNFIVTEFTEFYKRKLLAAALAPNLGKNANKQKSMAYYSVTESSKCDAIFTVSNAKKGVIYTVNTDVGICSCYAGVSGNLCKHQLLLPDFNYPLSSPISSQAKLKLHYLATGNTIIPDSEEQDAMQIAHVTPVGDSDEEPNHIMAGESLSCPVNTQDVEKALAALQRYGELQTLVMDIVKKNPAEYLESLESCNKELESIVRMPFKLKTALYSFNKNAGSTSY